MFSNSKLTADQKSLRKALINMLPAGSALALSATGVTFLTIPQGAVNHVYSAVASPDEKKIRRKVGEYHALARWDDANPSTVVVPSFMDAAFLAAAIDAQTEGKSLEQPDYESGFNDAYDAGFEEGYEQACLEIESIN